MGKLRAHEERRRSIRTHRYACATTNTCRGIHGKIGQLFRHPLPAQFEDRFVEGFEQEGGKLFRGWRELARKVDVLSMLDQDTSPGVAQWTTIYDVNAINDNGLIVGEGQYNGETIVVKKAAEE